MMKQRIVLKVNMHCPKCRTKAMKIAAVAQGVTSVALEGPERDRVAVVGIGVDSANLASSLERKVGKTTFISVSEVKPDVATKKPDEANLTMTSPWSYDPSSYPTSYSYPPTHPGYYFVSSNHRPPSICSIM